MRLQRGLQCSWTAALTRGALALVQEVISEQACLTGVCGSITVAKRNWVGRGSRWRDPLQTGVALALGPRGNERGAARVGPAPLPKEFPLL